LCPHREVALFNFEIDFVVCHFVFEKVWLPTALSVWNSCGWLIDWLVYWMLQSDISQESQVGADEMMCGKWGLQGPSSRASKGWRASASFQEFQGLHEFQAFQESAKHFKRVSRGSDGRQQVQEFQEHFSRVPRASHVPARCDWFHWVKNERARARPILESFQEFQ